MNDTAAAKATILIVEDEMAILETLVEILRFGGYRVLSARNGKEALDTILHDAPDLVVTDNMMPGMNGPQLARAVRQLPGARTIPVILVSAIAEPSIDDLETRPWSAYLAKPFDVDELLSLVARTLRGDADDS